MTYPYYVSTDPGSAIRRVADHAQPDPDEILDVLDAPARCVDGSDDAAHETCVKPGLRAHAHGANRRSASASNGLSGWQARSASALPPSSSRAWLLPTFAAV